jgi:protein-disulfide isomerase
MPPIAETQSIAAYVNDLLANNKVVVFTKTTCPWCVKVKALFKDLEQEIITIELDLVGKKTTLFKLY